MSGGVSPMGIVGINVVLLLVDVFVSREPGDEDPQTSSKKDSLPHGVRNIVPHLLVQKMDLLESSNVVFLSRSVCDCPNSKIVHVSHVLPRVLELNTILNNLVLKSWHLVHSSGWSGELLEPLSSSLHVIQLIHFNQ